jgi:N-acetylglucosamine kinase-like BadF-type ATPase
VTDNHDDRQPVAAVLAIDGGNSKTDVALVADDGSVLASVRGPGVSHEDFGLEDAMRRLGEIVEAAAGRAGLVARHTSACLAGADLPEEEAMLTAAILRQGWSQTAAVANDTFAVLRAGLTPADGERAWGVAITCGAGINCVGVSPEGATTRFLAFGLLSGDWGGGLGLGHHAVWHAIRAEDGRGEPTGLQKAVPAFYGLASMHDVAVAIHLGTLGEDDLIRLPAVLFATAETGDAVALSLVERQAEEVCLMALTAIGRLDLADVGAIPVVLGGGVLEARNPLLTAAITRRLAERAPRAVARVVDTPPVTGAALLGLDHLGAAPAAETRLRAAYDRKVSRAPVGAARRVGLA